jgi:hypothetical protein
LRTIQGLLGAHVLRGIGCSSDMLVFGSLLVDIIGCGPLILRMDIFSWLVLTVAVGAVRKICRPCSSASLFKLDTFKIAAIFPLALSVTHRQFKHQDG